MMMKSTVFRDVVPRSVVGIHHSFRCTTSIFSEENLNDIGIYLIPEDN
jgi:hypothetical protein